MEGGEGGVAPGVCCRRAREALAGVRGDCLVLNHRLEELEGVAERQAARIRALEASLVSQRAETLRVREEGDAALARQLQELEGAHREQLRRLREQIQEIRGFRPGRLGAVAESPAPGTCPGRPPSSPPPPPPRRAADVQTDSGESRLVLGRASHGAGRI